jgi:hypothetical protein
LVGVDEGGAVSLVQAPPALLIRSIGYRLRGRVHFLKESIGEVHPGPGESFVAFRKMVLDPVAADHPAPAARFTVRFHFKSLSPAANRRLSMLPAPFIATQPGFRSKTWTIGRQTGMFQGVYEWDTVGDAEAYWTSFPMRMMKRRAVPDSVVHEIEPL